MATTATARAGVAQVGSAAPAGPVPAAPTTRWQWAKRGLTIAFFALVAVLLLQQARSIDWSAVGTALSNYTWPTLLAAAALAASSHGLYASYELIGRHLTGHRLSARRVTTIGAVSYAFNLNLGSLIGGLALRYRLYARAGLPAAKAGQVIALSIVTNWLGYLALAGALFVWQPLDLPAGWAISTDTLHAIGLAMLALAGVYLVACALAPRRRWHWRGHAVTTPSAKLSWLQLSVSLLNWSSIAAIVWVLLEGRADFAHVALVLLVAAVAGVITHVPGNLGVLEAVFVALLGQQVAAEQLLAALIVYRALYYLLPLLLASVLLWRLERRKPVARPGA